MKKNTRNKIFLPGILAVILLALAGMIFYYGRIRTKTVSINSGSDIKIYSGLVEPRDSEPLVATPKAAQSGRTLVVPVLMYHHVGSLPADADSVRKDLTVPTQNFAAQVQWLNNNGYISVSLKDIYLASQGKFTLPKKPVVFTFDDGYLDVFQNAIPILTKYGYAGSFGIITQNPGTTQGDNVYASWPVIKAAAQSGEEIVSHTQNHFDGSNPKFSAAYIYGNLSGSISDIQKNLGFTTNILIYPYGHYTPVYLAEAEKAGFVMGVTVREDDAVNFDDLMEIPRVRVHGAETLQRFEDELIYGPQSFLAIPAVAPKTRTSSKISLK